MLKGSRKNRRQLEDDSDLEWSKKEGDHLRDSRKKNAICAVQVAAIYTAPILFSLLFLVIEIIALVKGEYVQAATWLGIVATNAVSYMTGRKFAESTDDEAK